MERKNWFMNLTDKELYEIKTDKRCKTEGDIKLMVDHPEYFIGEKALHPSPKQSAYIGYMEASDAFNLAQRINPSHPAPNFRSPYLYDRDVTEFLNELDSEIIFRWVKDNT